MSQDHEVDAAEPLPYNPAPIEGRSENTPASRVRRRTAFSLGITEPRGDAEHLRRAAQTAPPRMPASFVDDGPGTLTFGKKVRERQGARPTKAGKRVGA